MRMRGIYFGCVCGMALRAVRSAWRRSDGLKEKMQNCHTENIRKLFGVSVLHF